MIGDVPKGAPLRCKLHIHTGQELGGTMCFTCLRCGGTFWQRRNYSAVTALGDRMIEEGRGEEAIAMAQTAVYETEKKCKEG